MRKSNTLFDQVCQFINKQPIGSTFNVQDIYNACQENYTQWKRRYNDPGYCTRLYCGHLRRGGILAKYKRGTWTVLAHVPDQVTVFMLYQIGYKNRWHITKNNYLGTPGGVTIVEQESSEDAELIERLDGMLTIKDETGEHVLPRLTADVKYIYKFWYNDGQITKHRVWASYLLSANERETLLDALIALSNLTGKLIHDIGEDMLEKIENELHEKSELEKSQLDKELDKVAEKLNVVLRIIDSSSSPSSITKYIYKFIGGLLYKELVNVFSNRTWR